MSTLLEIESAIVQLPLSDVETLQHWLEQWLGDQRQPPPGPPASIGSSKAGPAKEEGKLPPDYFERVAGALAGERFERTEDGEFEERTRW